MSEKENFPVHHRTENCPGHPEALSVEEETFEKVTDLFRIMSDPTRLRILLALDGRELSVGCLSEEVGMTVSAVSHQLRILRDARLVSARREGKSTLCRLSDGHVCGMVELAVEHAAEQKSLKFGSF